MAAPAVPTTAAVVQLPPLSDVIWQFQDSRSNSGWSNMSTYWCEQHELQYRLYKGHVNAASCRLMGYRNSEGFMYDILTSMGEFEYRMVINFQNWTQTNSQTDTVRNLRRLGVVTL